MEYIATAWIFKDNKVLLIKHLDLEQWLPVGGHVEEGEAFDEALYREVEEEVGLKIELLEKDDLMEEDWVRDMPLPFRMSYKPGKAIIMDYLAEPLTTNIKLDKTESSDYKWFTLEEINKTSSNPRVKEVAKKAFEKYGGL